MRVSTELGTSDRTWVRPASRSLRPSRLSRTVGCLFLSASGIHVGIVAADPESYRSFAAGALPIIREAWSRSGCGPSLSWVCLCPARYAKHDVCRDGAINDDYPGEITGIERRAWRLGTNLKRPTRLSPTDS